MGDGALESPAALCENPNPNSSSKKAVVIMGATGAGKSRLAIDLAGHFSGVEIVNADSMQVYRGLDVLTNKVPFSDRKGVPHHLLGIVDSAVEFTSKDFCDLAVPTIDDILSRNCLPVIVGGTNYYIQALVSQFLVENVVEDMGEGTRADTQDLGNVDFTSSYERLKVVDPVAANRIHPNDHRKINRYLSLYASSGILPSTLFRGKAAEVKILRINSEYIDYTLGLRQAIGVREFDEFFKEYFLSLEAPGYSCCDRSGRVYNTATGIPILTNKADNTSGPTLQEILDSADSKLKYLLGEAIDKLKANTKRLVRRQIRRLNRLKTYFGWNLHYIDATEAFLRNSEYLWDGKVMEPSIEIIRSFLSDEVGVSTITAELSNIRIQSNVSRDLWSQYICEACGNQILRGSHEWEQHKQGRGHRKRILSLKKKSLLPSLAS